MRREKWVVIYYLRPKPFFHHIPTLNKSSFEMQNDIVLLVFSARLENPVTGNQALSEVPESQSKLSYLNHQQSEGKLGSEPSVLMSNRQKI